MLAKERNTKKREKTQNIYRHLKELQLLRKRRITNTDDKPRRMEIIARSGQVSM